MLVRVSPAEEEMSAPHATDSRTDAAVVPEEDRADDAPSSSAPRPGHHRVRSALTEHLTGLDLHDFREGGVALSPRLLTDMHPSHREILRAHVERERQAGDHGLRGSHPTVTWMPAAGQSLLSAESPARRRLLDGGAALGTTPPDHATSPTFRTWLRRFLVGEEEGATEKSSDVGGGVALPPEAESVEGSPDEPLTRHWLTEFLGGSGKEKE